LDEIDVRRSFAVVVQNGNCQHHFGHDAHLRYAICHVDVPHEMWRPQLVCRIRF
jgi:hypothetical protein